ncbi:hypothetical protein VNO78_06343 [Psophocarpus tetragonolobus]|uniref:Uncharacterized protein n=1 Tax=Psophocarpus tetragonolobus TaxID=3891 RepID=A0AAN9XRB3_PSOTE
MVCGTSIHYDRDAINDFLGGNFTLAGDGLDTFTKLKKNMYMLPHVLADKLCLPGRSYEVGRTGKLKYDIDIAQIVSNEIHSCVLSTPAPSGVSKPLAFQGEQASIEQETGDEAADEEIGEAVDEEEAAKEEEQEE